MLNTLIQHNFKYRNNNSIRKRERVGKRSIAFVFAIYILSWDNNSFYIQHHCNKDLVEFILINYHLISSSGVIPEVSGWGECVKHPQGTGPFLGAHWRRPYWNVKPVPTVPVLLPGLWGHSQHLRLQRSRGRSSEGQTWALWQQGEAHWWGGFCWWSSWASEQTLSLQGTVLVCLTEWKPKVERDDFLIFCIDWVLSTKNCWFFWRKARQLDDRQKVYCFFLPSYIYPSIYKRFFKILTFWAKYVHSKT